MPSISERLYIRWVPDDPNERTSTLVLTAHNQRFVDLRLHTPRTPSDPCQTLEWGFAGSSIGTEEHGVWSHDIDSLDMGGIDEGDMVPHPDQKDVTIERGMMRHPESGKIQEYEEAWKNVPVLALGNSRMRVSVVLETRSKIGEVGVAKGMIVRVGQFCQGIVKKGDVVHVERWKWTDGLGWRSIANIEDANLPCEETWRDGIKEGEIISEGGLDWCVREVYSW